MTANKRARPSRADRLAERFSPYWPRASLRTYLVIMILLATVPIAVLMGYQIAEQISTQRKDMRDDLQRTASVLAQTINREIESTVDALTILSFTSEIQRGEVALFARTLFERPVPRSSWKGIYLLGLDGQVLIDTVHPADDTPMRSRPRDMVDVLRQLAENNAAISNLERDELSGEYFTTVEVAVKVEGVPRYIIGALIPVTAWQRLGEETGLMAPGITSIVDRDFTIISRSLRPDVVIGTSMPEKNQTLIQARVSGTTEFHSIEGGFSNGAWERVPLAAWTALVGIPQGKVDTANRQAIFFALATAVSCLLLGVYLALLVARRLTVPLRQLARGEFHRASDRLPVEEIAQLRDALVAAQAQDEMNQDLLRRKRDLLQHKADEFESLIASIPVAVGFAQDKACEHISHNAAMDEMFGNPGPAPAEEMEILENGVVLAREDLPLQRAAAFGESVSDRELEVRRSGLAPSFVLCSAVPLYDGAGKPRGAIAAAVDITERKISEERLIEAQQQLIESQRLVDLAQESGQVGFFHYQVDADVLAWTPGQALLFGLGADEVESLSEWTQRIDRRDWQRMIRSLRRAFQTGQQRVTIDYRVHLPGGKSRWLSSRLRILDAESVASVASAASAAGSTAISDAISVTARQLIGITVDMSEQKAAQTERDALIVREQAARIDAEAANRSKDEFLAMLGHELRNPLSAISSGIEVLGRTDGDSELAINARRIIARQTRHLAHMLDDLLDVARVMAGRVELECQPLDLGALAARVMANHEISGEPREHLVQADIGEVWVDANATRLEQVITNLLVNAIKYTPPGGSINLRLFQDGDEAVLEVEDTGVGIDPELLPRVFDLFVQGDRSLDRRAGGMGVGLTLVRRLVELHGGTITAKNIGDGGLAGDAAKPTGTIMTVRLPTVARPELVKLEEPLPARRQRRIAIVEDNEDALAGLSSLLELEGHTVFTAVEGVSGLALILGTRPEVAIVDIGLPGMSGYEVARHSRAGGYPGKLIALTGYGQDNDKRAALAAGFDEHMLKPVSSKDLLRLIAAD